MKNGDDDPLTDVDRRGIRILARSTKAAGPNNARIAESLEKAAGSGKRGDYRRAGESFDSLPPIERKRIGTHAERQAENEKQQVEARKQQPKPPRPRPATNDDTLDWKPLILDNSPAADPDDGEAWKLGQAPADAVGKPAPSVPKPAARKRDAARTPPGRTAAPASGRTKKPAPAADDEPGESDGSWDWQRIPEDPVLKSTRRKAPADPIEELRRQMLGNDSKRR